MPRIKLEEIIESSDIKEFSQFFRLKTRAEGNFRPSDERCSQYDDADFFDFAKLGQIEFSGSERLLVASAEVGKDLSERSGKKAQYEKAKKVLRELSAFSAGIFIFYDKSGSFRFSLVYPEAVGTRREWSNFRRFTYFVSKELTNKTFLQRIGDGDFSTLDKIKDAFSVEKVTKEFYLEYRKLFDSLLEDLSKNHTFLNEASRNHINTENFAKKLLGQIVFLYFIQKKGWIGVPAGKGWGEGDKNFMGNIYKDATAKKANFYNDYLEKLFYNALNNPHRDSADPSFSKDFNSRIPFLNGGLFEAEYDWKNSLMYLDNKIFQSIFDVFERYNFTVEEESPDDKEIAVDPEMLGKVFENLLPENLRKGKGTYYTPREIVYYMCRESLINYLVSNHSNITEENIRNYIFYSESFENFKKQKGESFTPGQWKELDDLLVNIRVCDPACGSGAFLVGMLNMIAKLRIFLQTTPDSHLIPQKKEYELKRETIQNCIYGVDIDPGAIEIAKLRLWLALVVDYDLEDIEPLPNLDYRLMCGNSLLEEFEGIKFYNGEKETQATLLPVDPEKEKKVEALRKKVKEYFSIHDDKEKLKKRKEINDIKDWLIGTALKKRHKDITSQTKEAESRANMLDEKSRKQYLSGFSKWLGSSSNIQQALESLHNPKKEKPFFIWKLEFIDVFEEKGGFDVIIANPPYVKEYVQKSAFDGLRSSPYYQGKMDLWYFFACKGVDLARNDSGIITFIAQNNWVTSFGASKMRSKIISDTQILSLIDFGDFKIFEAGIQTMVMMFRKDTTANNYSFDYRRLFGNDLTLNDALAILNKNKNEKAEYLTPKVNRDTLRNKTLTFSNSGAEPILEKVLNKSNFQLSDKEVANGIHHHHDRVNRERNKILGNQYKVGDGIFVLSNEEKKQIPFTRTELELIKPSYTSKELHRWYANPVNQEWVIYTDSSFKDKKKIENYPNIKKHLDQFKKVITSDNKPYGLHRARDEYFFIGEKIMAVRKCAKPTFTYVGFDSYVSATFYVIKTERLNQKYLAGLLNSGLIAFWLRHKGKMQGNNYQIDKEPIIGLPILRVEQAEQNIIIDIVDKILAITKDSGYLKNSEKQAKVRDYEKQIDQFVYKLYGLTPEEIKIVESK